MKKNVLSLFLALAMLSALVSPTLAAEADSGFTDVASTAWYAEAVAYCQDNGLMSGTSTTTFAPQTTMTRSMLAMVLYRIAGEPAVSKDGPFTDVSNGMWYTNAVNWAQQSGIVEGYSDGRFGINDPISREQIAAILWRYSGSPEVEAGADFVDEGLISAYAISAVDWARATGIMNGKENNRFDPTGHATRAEVAVILMNYSRVQEPAPDDPIQPDHGNDSAPSILIAYFSWAGHTKQIAEEVQSQVGGDLFEIVPETPYTDDINELSGIASRELRENVRPALESHVENMEQYDVIFVGYPCWWSNAPMPVFTFLEEYSFAGKTIIPFTSYGESVWGRSLDSIQNAVGNDAEIAEGLAVQEHNMQDLPTRVAAWLQELDLT